MQGAFRLWPAKGLAIAGALLALLVWTASASAATGCPTSGLGSGLLPDCRVYEQVSPVDKNAFEAGSTGFESPGVTFASADGSRTFYPTSGPVGETDTGLQLYTMSTRTATGWHTRNAFPRPQHPDGIGFNQIPRSVLPSEDLSSFFFWAGGAWLPQVPSNAPVRTPVDAYQFGVDQPMQWVTEPQYEDALQPHGGSAGYYRARPTGASPSLDRVYFNYLGTLFPDDEPRRPYAEEEKALGLYEYAEGELRNAGTLPDGTLDPMGAVAAGSVLQGISFVDRTSPESTHHQVSDDGRTLWFVSPDPTPDRSRIAQLYVRANGASELVSRSELTDQPAASGVRPVPHAYQSFSQIDSYAFAAADGSRAFFRSTDRLTDDAPEDATPKAYMYEASSGDLVYVPALNGAHILEGSDDGSRLLLLNGDRTRLELWEEGSGLTLVSETSAGAWLPTTRATADGSVFAFTLGGELPGFPNPEWLPQAYRYEVGSGDLDCLSCPPGGSPPFSGVVMSRTPGPMTSEDDGTVVGMRAMSADGKWVFFDTADPLVPRDTNGMRDAYRWSEADGPQLISSGRSGIGSFMLDISADGTTAFFTTSEGISPSDVDGSYDVYAARIGGGFPSTELPPCEGGSCRGPIAGPPTLLDPVSETLPGRGEAGSESRHLLARLSGRDGKLRLRVSAPAAGRLVVSGPRVQPLKHRIAKPGAYVLRPRLRPGALEALDRRGRLTVRVKVRFVPREGRASSRVIKTEVTR